MVVCGLDLESIGEGCLFFFWGDKGGLGGIRFLFRFLGIIRGGVLGRN